jgi:hypothetical protein
LTASGRETAARCATGYASAIGTRIPLSSTVTRSLTGTRRESNVCAAAMPSAVAMRGFSSPYAINSVPTAITVNTPARYLVIIHLA